MNRTVLLGLVTETIFANVNAARELVFKSFGIIHKSKMTTHYETVNR